MIESLFRPESIAVVGASNDKNKVGNIIFRNIISTFNGKIFAVNTNGSVIENYQSYKSLKDINEKVDLVVVAVPRDAVPSVIQDAVDIKAGAAIIITSGFKETDEHGADLEKQVINIARNGNLSILGPNTIGLITPNFNATFAFEDTIRGNSALVAQSGGLGVYMLEWAQKTKTGISYFVSLGNQSDITESDVYEYLSNDVETRAIFSYIEGVSDGDKFLNVVPEIVKKKPMIFLKGGVSKSGSAAIKTHTGSVAGSIDIFKAAVRTCGGIFVDSLEDMLNIARLVNSSENVSSDILIITNSGGHGVLTTDAIDIQEMNEIQLPDRIKKSLLKILPKQSVPRNPIDLSGDADYKRYSDALETVKDLDCTKVVIVQSLPMVTCTDVARAVIKYKGTGVIGVVMGMDEDSASKLLDSASIPSFKFPEDAIKAIKYMTSRWTPDKKIRISEPPEEAKKLVAGKNYLRDFEAMKLMEIYGIKTPKWKTVENESDLDTAADYVGYPLVMKISPDEPVHKTDVNGVIMNVQKENLHEAFKQLNYKRVLLQEQISGAEIFIGGIKDPVFGYTVVSGVGGIYMEVLKDLSYGLAPVSENEAMYMMDESKVTKMLSARKRNYDRLSLIRAITNISRLIVDLDVSEMDINPVIVNQNGAYAVDVRILLNSKQE